jgi:hypothetical protein
MHWLIYGVQSVGWGYIIASTNIDNIRCSPEYSGEKMAKLCAFSIAKGVTYGLLFPVTGIKLIVDIEYDIFAKNYGLDVVHKNHLTPMSKYRF